MLKNEKIKLNKNIYPEKKVLETAKTYKDFCKIKIGEETDYLVLDITYDNKHYMPGEISNYLISILKE